MASFEGKTSYQTSSHASLTATSSYLGAEGAPSHHPVGLGAVIRGRLDSHHKGDQCGDGPAGTRVLGEPPAALVFLDHAGQDVRTEGLIPRVVQFLALDQPP